MKWGEGKKEELERRRKGKSKRWTGERGKGQEDSSRGGEKE